MQIENFFHIKRFLERFTKKVFTFMQTNDQENMLLKNKISRDMQTAERVTDDKIRNFRTMINE